MHHHCPTLPSQPTTLPASPTTHDAQVVVKVSCLAPVEEVPGLTLHYQLGPLTVAQPLRLPVTNCRFLVPEPGIPKELFFEQWKAIG